jgi:hypothetical protein
MSSEVRISHARLVTLRRAVHRQTRMSAVADHAHAAVVQQDGPGCVSDGLQQVNRGFTMPVYGDS